MTDQDATTRPSDTSPAAAFVGPGDSAGAAAATPAAAFRPVVIAPTFNNAGTLPDVLRRLDAQHVPVIAVNDGSTDGTAAVLARWAAEPGPAARHVESHPRNRGKAAALRTGFARAAALGFTHALSIDTDGQLAPEQVPDALAVARANPDALVLGVRDDTAPDYPGRSRLGRRVANMLVRMESGVRVADSQCGLRVYPLAMTQSVRCRAGRYGYETEVIVRAAWAGWPVAEVPASCTYFQGDRRVSHFRPVVDSLRASAMHARLVARTLLPIRHGRRHEPGGPAAGAGPTWRRLLNWMNPFDAWRQLRADRPQGADRTAMAGGIAIGAFIGSLPLYGVQAPLGLYVARRLSLNPWAVVLGTQVAFPPLGIALAVAAVGAGHLVLHGHIPPPSDFAPLWEGWRGLLNLGAWFFVDWAVGSVVVGAVVMVAAFFVSDWLLRRVPRAKADAAMASA
ncbi:MAG TPA: DUF2062 domain-containing protein [Humisphaera sp.]